MSTWARHCACKCNCTCSKLASVSSTTQRACFVLLVWRVLFCDISILKFILFFFFSGAGGLGRNSFCFFVGTQSYCETYGFALGSRIKLLSVFQNVKTTKYWAMPTEKWQTTIGPSFATILLDLHGFVSKETRERKCPLSAPIHADAGQTLRDG